MKPDNRGTLRGSGRRYQPGNHGFRQPESGSRHRAAFNERSAGQPQITNTIFIVISHVHVLSSQIFISWNNNLLF
jgi:hypothetical protein